MTKRRFSITEKEGYLITAALLSCISILEEAEKETTIAQRERLTLAELKTLQEKLSKYKWEK